MISLVRSIPSITAAGLLVAFSGQAIADSGLKASALKGVSTTVDASDLNLSNVEEARLLYARIGDAARKACRSLHPYSQSIFSRQQRAQCVELAIDNAVNRASSPQLSAVHSRIVPEQVVRR